MKLPENLRVSPFNKELSNETTFNLIHLAGQYLSVDALMVLTFCICLLMLVLKTFKATDFALSNETDYFSEDFYPENAYRKPPVLLKNYTENRPSNFSAFTLYPRKDDNGEWSQCEQPTKMCPFYSCFSFYSVCRFRRPAIYCD